MAQNVLPGTILDITAIRLIETDEGPQATPPLMERAGLAAASQALSMIKDRSKPVLVLAGPGNNGGDGFVVARELEKQGWEVYVVFSSSLDKLPSDAASAYQRFIEAGGTTESEIPDKPWGLIVDALFGIGGARPIRGAYSVLVQTINKLDVPVLSLDIPSGLEADTGTILGCAVKATQTACFIALKPGILTLDGPDYCGKVVVHDLGLKFPHNNPDFGVTLAPSQFGDFLKPRLSNSHKGSFGTTCIVGGAPGMTGAPLLAGRAALKTGSGKVLLAMLDRATLRVDPGQPELMFANALRLPEADAFAVGPGLGRSSKACVIINKAIHLPLPLVLDADALNLISVHKGLQAALSRRVAPTILTPHPAEAARLLGVAVTKVQANRLAAARSISERYKAHIVLKGNGSVVVHPDGSWAINTSGNPGLATAGSGDTLCGIIVSLLAQGWEATQALNAGVHLHGCAADWLVANGKGPVGLAASELADAARYVLNDWIAHPV